MSIILKALKKIQNQGTRDQSGTSAAGSREVEEPASDAFSPVSTPMEAIRSADTGAAFAGIPRIQEGWRSSARPDTPLTGHRFGIAPKLLLALIIVLGVFSSGWFVSGIYSSLRLPPEKGKAESRFAPDQPQQLMRATQIITPESQSLTPTSSQPPALVTEHTTPSTVTAPIITPPTQLARSASAAAAPQPEPANMKEQPPESAAPEPVRAKPEERVKVEKESKPGKKGRPELKINAIASRSTEPKAIVNMQRVYVGDEIEGATILAINRKSILFEYEGESFEVRF